MKDINSIEKMTLEELERAADDLSVEVPEIIGEKVRNIIAVQAVIEDVLTERSAKRSMKRDIFRYAALAISGTAACIVMFLATTRQPKDTFDDPRLAYAELEKTFAFISSKMDKGIAIASEVEPVLEKTGKVFNNKINENKK